MVHSHMTMPLCRPIGGDVVAVHLRVGVANI